MTFMEAISFIESLPEDKQISVGSDYYQHLAANDKAFEEMVIADKQVSIEKPMVAGNDAKVIKLLKAVKSEKRLTDNQEDTLELLITVGKTERCQPGFQDVLKKSVVTADVLELYYEILKLVPQTYLDEQTSGKSLRVEGEKQSNSKLLSER